MLCLSFSLSLSLHVYIYTSSEFDSGENTLLANVKIYITYGARTKAAVIYGLSINPPRNGRLQLYTRVCARQS